MKIYNSDFRYRLRWLKDLDPLAILIQRCTADGLELNHIFYRLVTNACQFVLDGSDLCKQFQWGKELKEFPNALEMVRSTSAVNIYRGPGPKREKNKPYKFSWDNVNFPLPSKYVRRKLQPMVVTDRGIIHHLLINFIKLAQQCAPLTMSDLTHIVPVCISRDAMAIKPGGLRPTAKTKL